ncbi:hypothetical protein BS78_K027800 [Paspalum vaginatum]|uniref:Uncharacterized protein n=1 Tax=Paspalum vaginatum TaxID=158149 RepID=A0A9W7X7B5_9POAL|nr:hypothetical protein BS78_K027800 [Paspalum vaginatum]
MASLINFQNGTPPRHYCKFICRVTHGKNVVYHFDKHEIKLRWCHYDPILLSKNIILMNKMAFSPRTQWLNHGDCVLGIILGTGFCRAAYWHELFCDLVILFSP